MTVSIGIFSVVIVTAIGVFLALEHAQLKASNIQVIQDNLRFAIESVTREIRTGRAFAPATGASCPPACAELRFTTQEGELVGYCLRDAAVHRFRPGAGEDCAAGRPITASEVAIESFTFYIIGQAPGPDDGQPRVTLSLRARSRDPELATAFELQTTVTPRIRDAIPE